MPSKTKTKTAKRTKLLNMVCKRAALMRAHFRVTSYTASEIIQTKSNSLPNNKSTEQHPSSVGSSKKETNENVSAYIHLDNIHF